MTHIDFKKPWILTISGRPFPLIDPKPANVDWRDMVTVLSREGRFANHTVMPYSVAQHVLEGDTILQSALANVERQELLIKAAGENGETVKRLLEAAARDDGLGMKLRRAWLLHDGHEYVTGDISTPIAKAIRMASGATEDGLAMLKTRIDEAIYTAAELPYPMAEPWRLLIRTLDMLMLSTEVRDCMPEGPWDTQLPEPWITVIKPRGAELIEQQFLKRLETVGIDYRRKVAAE